MKRALGFMNKALPISYNTYIGGISATVGTDALLATKLGISVGAISNFTVVGSDIKCKITGSYGISNSAFQFNTTPSTYYIDSDYLVTSIESNAFYYTNIAGIADFQNALSVSDAFRGTPLLTEILLKNVTSVGNNGFAESTNGTQTLRVCYIPSCTSLGTTSGNNGVFVGSKSFLKIYAHPSLQTNNAGGVDGDLTDAISRGATVAYVTNFTAPLTPTITSIGIVYNTSIQLVDAGGNTNAIGYFEVTVNGVPYGNINAGSYITGLTPSTNYNITLVAVDIFYNKSGVSNSITQSTNTTSAVPTRGLVSHYKFDETSGITVNDSYGTDHLTNTNVAINKLGIIGKSYYNDSNAGKNLYSTTTTPITGNFTINIWVYRTATIMGANSTIVQQGQFSSAGFGLWIKASTNQVAWRVNATYNNYSPLVIPPLNKWCMLTLTWDGSNIKVYMDSVLKVTTAWTTAPITSPNRRMFNRSTNNEAFIGNLDLCSFHNVALNQTEIDLLYNAGTGITL